MSIRTTLDELLELSAYKAGLEARIGRLRDGLDREARRQYEEMDAAPSWKAKGSGTVALVVPEPKPVVVDETAWLAYMKETSPGDVEVVERVRAHVLEQVVGRCEMECDVHYFDPSTGEVIPGVEPRQGSPYLRVTLDADRKRAAIEQALDDLPGEAA